MAMKDNPRLFNLPPRDSDAWKLEYNARTSAERSNKREKLDFKLEDGRHRSTKIWYCRLYWWQHDEKTPKTPSAKIQRSVKITPVVERPKSFEDYQVELEPVDCVKPEVYNFV